MLATADQLLALFEQRFDIPEDKRDLIRVIAEATTEYAAEMVSAEREACAKIADHQITGTAHVGSKHDVAQEIARKIRARGAQT